MIARILRTTRIVIVTLGCLLSFFAVLEVLRAYAILRDLSPVVGALFGWGIVCAIAGVAGWYAISLGSRPRVLRAPPVTDLDAPHDHRALRRLARYQAHVNRRLARNPLAMAEARTRAREGIEALRAALRERVDDASLRSAIADARAGLEDGIRALDVQANTEVARCVRDVMLAVTVSPWRSADLGIVLYRNLRMVMRLSAIYNVRPPVREQFAILRDVLTVVATVNFLNYGSNLLQNLTASVPLLGRFTDDVAQGVGAGLLTSVAGHAAVDRCRSYGHWNRDEAARTVQRKLRDFLADVKQVVVTDVLQRIRRPVEAQIPETDRPPEMQERLRDGVAAAMDDTAAIMDTFLVRPVAAAGRGMAGTGVFVGRTVFQGSTATVSGAWSGVRAMARLTTRTVTGSARATHRGAAAAWRQLKRFGGRGKTGTETPEPYPTDAIDDDDPPGQ